MNDSTKSIGALQFLNYEEKTYLFSQQFQKIPDFNRFRLNYLKLILLLQEK